MRDGTTHDDARSLNHCGRAAFNLDIRKIPPLRAAAFPGQWPNFLRGFLAALHRPSKYSTASRETAPIRSSPSAASPSMSMLNDAITIGPDFA